MNINYGKLKLVDKNGVAIRIATLDDIKQSDWSVTDPTSFAYIKNKPPLFLIEDKLKTIEPGAQVNTIEGISVNGKLVDIVNKIANINVEIGSSVEWDNILNKPEDLIYSSDLDEYQKKITETNKLSSNLIDTNETNNKFITTELLNKLNNIESGAQVNVQADWTEINISSDSYIKNKPNLEEYAKNSFVLSQINEINIKHNDDILSLETNLSDLENNKLDKISPTWDGATLLYSVKRNYSNVITQQAIEYTTNATQNTIPIRDGYQNFRVANRQDYMYPNNSDEEGVHTFGTYVANYNYVDDEIKKIGIENYIKKNSIIIPEDKIGTYISDSNYNISAMIISEEDFSSIPLRNSAGIIKGVTPVGSTGNILANCDYVINKIENSGFATKSFVNSSIATNTATFKGTFDSLQELENVSGADNNDYGFVITKDDNGNTLYNKYKYNGSSWVFEYTLNNSSFTSEQWTAINSGATQVLIQQITENKNNIQTLNNNKVDKEPNKGLSENDFTTSLMTKLDGIEPGAQVNVLPDWNGTGASFILNKPPIKVIQGDPDESYSYNLNNLTESGIYISSGVAYLKNGPNFLSNKELNIIIEVERRVQEFTGDLITQSINWQGITAYRNGTLISAETYEWSDWEEIDLHSVNFSNSKKYFLEHPILSYSFRSDGFLSNESECFFSGPASSPVYAIDINNNFGFSVNSGTVIYNNLGYDFVSQNSYITTTSNSRLYTTFMGEDGFTMAFNLIMPCNGSDTISWTHVIGTSMSYSDIVGGNNFGQLGVVYAIDGDGHHAIRLYYPGVTYWDSLLIKKDVNDGLFHNYLIVYNKTESKIYIYIDGTLKNSKNITSDDFDSNLRFSIGGRYGDSSSNSFSSGILNNFKFYNKPFTAEESAEYYKFYK